MTGSNGVARLRKSRPRLKHPRKFLLISDLRKMYRGINEPYFSYCCLIWGCCGESGLSSPYKLQNRAARTVTNSHYDEPADPLLQSLDRHLIKDLIRKKTAMLTSKSLNSLAPQYSTSKLSF